MNTCCTSSLALIRVSLRPPAGATTPRGPRCSKYYSHCTEAGGSTLESVCVCVWERERQPFLAVQLLSSIRLLYAVTWSVQHDHRVRGLETTGSLQMLQPIYSAAICYNVHSLHALDSHNSPQSREHAAHSFTKRPIGIEFQRDASFFHLSTLNQLVALKVRWACDSYAAEYIYIFIRCSHWSNIAPLHMWHHKPDKYRLLPHRNRTSGPPWLQSCIIIIQLSPGVQCVCPCESTDRWQGSYLFYLCYSIHFLFLYYINMSRSSSSGSSGNEHIYFLIFKEKAGCDS